MQTVETRKDDFSGLLTKRAYWQVQVSRQTGAHTQGKAAT